MGASFLICLKRNIIELSGKHVVKWVTQVAIDRELEEQW